MPIGVSEDHVELQQTIRRFAEEQLAGRAREYLDLEAELADTTLPELRDMGLVGIHIGTELGGEGATFLELAIVAEELGRVVAPGGFLTTALAAALLERGAASETAHAMVPRLLSGDVAVTVALMSLGAPTLSAEAGPDGSLLISGTLPSVLAARGADAMLCVVTHHTAARLVMVPLGGEGCTTIEHVGLDPTRRVTTVVLDKVVVSPEHIIEGISITLARALCVTLAAAELTGGARACLEAANEYAKTRIQFGRPIGQFQAVKHRLADLLVAVEQMTAATWDAALAIDHLDAGDPSTENEAVLCAEAAAALTLDGGVRAAKDAIQVLGGMGFTWEHDAHLFLRRAATLRGLLGTGAASRRAVASMALEGTRRNLGIDLPEEAHAIRATIEPLVAEVAAGEASEHTALLGERGLQFPHWPVPYGRGAGAVEQLVIDEVLAEADVRRPPAHVTAWALPTLIAHGTPEQQERFVAPSIRGQIIWCQLFSEPGAGSDLASLTTKATRVDGGWQIDGQKVWTSAAKWASFGILLARSDPDAPKHQGITYFVLDMKSPGVDIRPLREITGESLFNEVFLDGVFIPDDCVVGAVNDGWKLARTTLSNERVALAGSSAFGEALEGALSLVADQGADDSMHESLGRLLVDAQSLSQMRQRSVLRSVFGLEPGPEASLAKLLGAEHDQRVADLGLDILGASGPTGAEGPAALFSRQLLHTLCLTIAGGTSEVQRNVIGERMLGLPRDPEPQA
ncbi:MAG: acyl-CoA dehydrogenase, partial [Actinomycetes bacterium]